MTLSVLAIVVVGATGAFFNDTETSTGNVFTAGSVDLKVNHTKQTYNGVDCQTCTVEIFSSENTRVISSSAGAASEGDLPKDAELVADPNPAWLDASTIAPAEWIWVTPTVDPGDTQNNAEYTFEDTFFLQGPVALTDFELEIASDNGYKIELNGTTIVDRLNDTGTFTGLNPLTDPQETAFQNALIQNGQNSLQITVRNLEGSANPDQNPAGLIYLIEFNNQDCEQGVADFQANCQLWQERDLTGSEQFFSFGDIKPGDLGTNVISLHVYDNPSYACLIAHNALDDENGIFDPEGDDDATAGELQDYIDVFTWIDSDQDGQYDPSDEDELGMTTLGNLGSVAALDSGNGQFLAPTTTEYIGLAWCAGTLEVDTQSGEFSCDATTMLNDAQSDIFTASLTAYAEQTRNNDSFSCGDVVLDEEEDDDAGEIIVDADSTDWGFLDETTESFSDGSSNGTFVSGPASVPLGAGSAQLSVSDGGGLVLGAALLTGQRLDEIDTLSYSTYRQSGDAPLAVALQFNFTDDVTGSYPGWQGRLVYEPYFTDSVQTGVWQTWNTLNDAPNGNWWFSAGPGDVVCPQSNPCTWSEVLAAFPDGGINSSFGGVLFKAGGGWSSDFVGNVDNLTIGINGSIQTFDFEN